MDPVLPRSSRPHLRHAPPLDRPGLRRPSCRPTCSATTSSRASSPIRSGLKLRDESGSTTCAGSRTTRTPTRRGPTSARGAAIAATLRRHRRRAGQDHARERDALVPVRSVRASGLGSAARSARSAPRCPITTWRSARWTRPLRRHAADDARRARRTRPREPDARARDDYAGPFDPTVNLTQFSRHTLARLGREWLLHGHLQDRVGMPLVLAGHTRQEMLDVAIEEWMAASPLYSLRTQRRARLRQRRRAHDPQEHPARHRRAASLHGLPLPGRRRRAR